MGQLKQARGLYHFHDQLRQLQPDEVKSRKPAILCEDKMSLIEQRTALANQLQSVLKQEYPQTLDFITDWAKPTA